MLTLKVAFAGKLLPCDIFAEVHSPFALLKIHYGVWVETAMPSTSNTANSCNVQMCLCMILLCDCTVLMACWCCCSLNANVRRWIKHWYGRNITIRDFDVGGVESMYMLNSFWPTIYPSPSLKATLSLSFLMARWSCLKFPSATSVHMNFHLFWISLGYMHINGNEVRSDWFLSSFQFAGILTPGCGHAGQNSPSLPFCWSLDGVVSANRSPAHNLDCKSLHCRNTWRSSRYRSMVMCGNMLDERRFSLE